MENPLIGFFVLAHDRRKLLHINVTSSPTGEWLKDQLMLALGTSASLKYLLSDNDQLYRPIRALVSQVLDLNAVTTQLTSPWQNGVVERFIRTLREDLLHCIIPYSETMVRARLQEHLHYYNEDRTHSSVDIDSPDGLSHRKWPIFGKSASNPGWAADAHGGVYARTGANVCGATDGESRRHLRDYLEDAA